MQTAQPLIEGFKMNLYEITDRYGRHLCYQGGRSEAEALESARDYYGHSGAKRATFVREWV